MAFILDPRGDLPLPTIVPSSYYYTRNHRRAVSYVIPNKKAKEKKCYDWIFSTASNVHVAIDRTAFKTYVAFKSYVLTVADQRQVTVRGVGTIEIKLKREPGSRDNHTITLENVLHVPDWICNVISDIYFLPTTNYEHTWTDSGVNFFARDKNSFKPWGYTESFCGLDRLILAKSHQGRSPMLDDPDREVFSVSLTWPQSHKDKWNDVVAAEMGKEVNRFEKGFKKKISQLEEKGLRKESKSSLVESAK